MTGKSQRSDLLGLGFVAAVSLVLLIGLVLAAPLIDDRGSWFDVSDFAEPTGGTIARLSKEATKTLGIVQAPLGTNPNR